MAARAGGDLSEATTHALSVSDTASAASAVSAEAAPRLQRRETRLLTDSTGRLVRVDRPNFLTECVERSTAQAWSVFIVALVPWAFYCFHPGPLMPAYLPGMTLARVLDSSATAALTTWLARSKAAAAHM
eukprot:CAMPEP_0115541728 /NCGR_PEP_ID=MMETSP0271-20121206/90621_1 /TAXON_ID=71861 /ORGANISM="Scrippsiella trochoidea, Strain CCMP3099" /LENGTH=129 /DNA_ID=CAMNT_0002974819 /DNA_START=13 /DNA_END=402 /DNA_ORIENTATION=+